MNQFILAVCFNPLGVYLILIGSLQLRRAPFLVGGGRDLLALSLGISGFVLAGPAQFFFPRALYGLIGTNVWWALATLYFLVITLLVLMQLPRLVIYGVDRELLVNSLVHACEKAGIEVRWMGTLVEIPSLGISASLERAGFGPVFQLRSANRYQSFEGWLQVESLLRQELSRQRAVRTAIPVLMLTAGLAMTGSSLGVFLQDPVLTAQNAETFFRF